MEFSLEKHSASPIPVNSDVICTLPQKNKKEKKNKRKINTSFPYCSFSLIFQNHLISAVPMRLDGDLILFDSPQLDEDGEVRGVLQVYNNFKRISSLTYDLNSQLLHVHLETTSHFITPLENINNRLLSLNDPDAKKLTPLLTLFQSSIEKMRHKVFLYPSVPSLKSDFEYKRLTNNVILLLTSFKLIFIFFLFQIFFSISFTSLLSYDTTPSLNYLLFFSPLTSLIIIS